MTKNALAKAAESAGLVPQNHKGPVMGIEGIDDKDLKIASVILVQDMTKVFTKKGLKPGEFVNTITEKAIADMTFIPAFMTKIFQVYSYADKSKPNGDFLFACTDEKDARLVGKRWRQDGDAKAEVIPCIKVAAIMGQQPVLINFKKASGYGAGQRLYTYARDGARTKNLPLWGQKYSLSSKVSPSKAGIEYYAMEVGVLGVTTAEEREFAEELYHSFKGSKDSVVEVTAEIEEVPF